MSSYVELYLGNELTKLRDGLDVMERVIGSEKISDLELFLYVTTVEPSVLDAARESIHDNIDAVDESLIDDNGSHSIQEEDIEINEIGIAIPISGISAVDSLYGRGYALKNVDFVYKQEGNEGIRSMTFSQRSSSAQIRLDHCRDKALAETDIDLPDFFKEKMVNSSLKIKKKVQRDEMATEKPLEDNKQEAPTGEPIKKQTSLKSVIEDFLGNR